MLWIKVKVGGKVFIDDSVLTLVDKDVSSIIVDLDSKKYQLTRNDFLRFPTFVLHAGNSPGGLVLGFEAPKSVVIRREKLETQLPTG